MDSTVSGSFVWSYLLSINSTCTISVLKLSAHTHIHTKKKKKKEKEKEKKRKKYPYNKIENAFPIFSHFHLEKIHKPVSK